MPTLSLEQFSRDAEWCKSHLRTAMGDKYQDLHKVMEPGEKQLMTSLMCEAMRAMQAYIDRAK